VKVLRAEATFDPSSCSLKSRPDPVWGANWGHLADMVPDDFEQLVARVPNYMTRRHEPHFNGWRWLCPGCGKRVRTVFYPIAPVNLPEYFGIEPAKLDCDQIQHPPGALACCRCHGVRYFYRLGPNAWNEMIYHVSGGLLYGYEVPRPAWVTHDRKRAYHPQNRRVPSRRREQVLERLLAGWAYARIALDLGIGLATVRSHVDVIYKQHHVHGRDELIRMMRPKKVLATDGARIDTDVTREPQDAHVKAR
jgi:DNA-binding CsgD family transcriptional regulator